MEIIIKTKQKFNPFFSFLNYEDELFPYYKFLKELISVGTYQPQTRQEASEEEDVKKDNFVRGRNGSVEREKRSSVDVKTVSESEKSGSNETPEQKSHRISESGDDDEEEEEGYLHPLLVTASLQSSKPSTPEPTPAPSSSSSSVAGKDVAAARTMPNKKMTVDELLNLHQNSASFVSRSLAINSAPPLLNSVTSTEGQPTSAYGTAYTDPDAVAAYERYRQHYYGRYE